MSNIGGNLSPKKKVTKVIKLEIPAGKATPAPPIGPVLGQSGVNIMEFCKTFNAATSQKPARMPIPVEIFVYADRTFYFRMKEPPASYWLRQAAKINKGSGTPGKSAPAGFVTEDQLFEIAKSKIVDMNAYDVEKAVRSLAGSARSAGIEVKKS